METEAQLKEREETSRKVHTGILKSAGAMGSATFLSRISGLLREEVIAFLFGAGNATDAYNLAFRIPNLLRDLFAEGAMSAALVPTFTEVRVREGKERAWRVAGRVFRILFFIAIALTAIGMIFTPELVGLYADAFHKVPGKFELSVTLTRIMFPFFPLIALAAAFMGILNACGVFFLPAFASALFNLTSVFVGIGIYLFAPKLGIEPIVGMAIGVVIGGAVQAFCQLPKLYQVGYRWKSKLPGEVSWYRDPALKKMLWLMIPGTIGLGATQINILVNTILATSEGPGAISWLNYAFRLMQFPIGLLGVSLAAATLPRISELKANSDFRGFSETLSKSLQVSLAINLMAAAGLAFLGNGIVQMLFEYGHFHASDTEATALALSAYSIGLISYSAVKIMVPACYALGNTKVPVFSSVLSVAVTIVLNILMVKRFGFAGLALGTSCAAIVNSIYLYIALNRMMKKEKSRLPVWPIVKTILVYLAIASLLGILARFTFDFICLHLSDQILTPFIGRIGIPLIRALRLGIAFGEFFLLAFIIVETFKLSEFSGLWSKIRSKLGF